MKQELRHPQSPQTQQSSCESPSPRETSPTIFAETILLALEEIIRRDFSRDWEKFLRYFVKTDCNILGRGLAGGGGRVVYIIFLELIIY